MRDIQSIRFTRKATAEILGMADGQLANWLARYNPTSAGPDGAGRSTDFRLADILKIEAMRLLVLAGVEPAKAAGALQPFQGPYGAILHGPELPGHFPGESFMALSADGKWHIADSATFPLVINLRGWAIFDRVFPRLKKHYLDNVRSADLESTKDDFGRFEAKIEEIRRQRWGD